MGGLLLIAIPEQNSFQQVYGSLVNWTNNLY